MSLLKKTALSMEIWKVEKDFFNVKKKLSKWFCEIVFFRKLDFVQQNEM